MSDNNWSNWYTYYLNCQFECAQIIAQQCANAHKQKLAHVAEYVFLKKKRSYSRKRFWVSPICSQREKHGFFKAILPSLQLEHLGFYNYFRMSSTKMEELLTLVGEDLKKQNCIRKPIPPAQRLALTLRFLASGDSMTSMHYQYLVGVTTASNIINTTCAVLWKKLQPLCMPAELKKEQWFAIEKDFKEKWNFPHCIGAIDGKHVCPNKAGSMYFNYKNSHSLVLLAMCNANYIFTFVDIGAYGRRSDGGIFKDSLLGQKLEGNKMNIPDSTPISDVRATPLPYCIVGDEAFPLKTYLLRPYPGKQSTELPKRIFNYRLSRARRVIENTFGILVAKWRIFWKPIIASDSNVVKMVKATVVLHNWLRQHDLDNSPEVSYVSEELFNQEHCYDSIINSTRRNEEHGRLIDINRMGSNNATHTAIQIREEFTSYFNNEGAVNWQYDHL
ncbi:uncharacterized protein [Temnothorax longispinosus]|uniref:uncharacterized protein isoform X2 n=1 Tax=Temnothorax longispinosus TaxID=300112 RepID=UPI003A99EB27